MISMSTADANRRKEARERAEKLVQAYYQRLARGCGARDCTNENCRSSSQFRVVAASDLPKLAVELARGKARLCPLPETLRDVDKQTADEPDKQQDQNAGAGPVAMECCEGESNVSASQQQPVAVDTAVSFNTHRANERTTSCEHGATASDERLPVTLETTAEDTNELGDTPRLELAEVLTLVADYQQTQDSDALRTRLQEVFSQWRILSTSFRASPDKLAQRSPQTQGESSNEPMDIDEARDHAAPAPSGPRVSVDMESVRASYTALSEIEAGASCSVIIAHALSDLSVDLRSRIRLQHLDTLSAVDPQSFLDLAVVLLEIPWLLEPSFLEAAVACILQFCAALPKLYRIALARHFATYSAEQLERLVVAVQQFFAFHIAMEGAEDGEFEPDAEVRDGIVVMEVFYAAALLGGEKRKASAVEAAAATGSGSSNTPWPATMASYLTMVADEEEARHRLPRSQSILLQLRDEQNRCRRPLVPYAAFLSEPLNSALDRQIDYINFQYNTFNFSVMRYPFLMSAEVKSYILQMNCRVRMRLERGHIVQVGNTLYISPYLKIQVRRDNIIQDTLTRLEIADSDDPHSLQKQLYVEFEGEQGIDEGGVQKEFFQILTESLFNADFGMFTWDEQTRLFWFNSMSFENDSHFSLIGMLLGLALYNNVILDVHFPMVVYRKLMGLQGTFDDLLESHPTIANSLQQMLDYDGDNFVDVFICNFCVGYHSVFGEPLTYDLVPNGTEVIVTMDNRQEYADLYTDFLLNKMISVQFEAFKKGFTKVTHTSNLSDWFLPDDLELLICGRKDLDFVSFEASTEYDGYEKDSPIIQHFWEIVHGFSEEQKRQLLSFCTGSDRVPVGGLKQLRFTIVRSGPESDRLPSAHTCFNTLLLPHYSNQESLRTRLLIAISHGKGFGMV